MNKKKQNWRTFFTAEAFETLSSPITGKKWVPLAIANMFELAAVKRSNIFGEATTNGFR